MALFKKNAAHFGFQHGEGHGETGEAQQLEEMLRRRPLSVPVLEPLTAGCRIPPPDVRQDCLVQKQVFHSLSTDTFTQKP